MDDEHLKSKTSFAAKDADRINGLLEGCHGIYAHNAEFDGQVLDHQF